MHSTASLQKEEQGAFTAAFYRPYEQAIRAAAEVIGAARRELVLSCGEDIRALTCRLKTPQSIAGKLRDKGLPVTCGAARAALRDIAGMRVVLGSVPQVYRFAGMIAGSRALEVCGVRDYIASPKESGYRSLHLLLRVPVCVCARMQMVDAELQLRTAGMDAWASIEHDMVYKPRACGEMTGENGAFLCGKNML